jgi:hypothetical protein
MDFLASLGMKTLQSAYIPEEFHCPSNFDVCFAAQRSNENGQADLYYIRAHQCC